MTMPVDDRTLSLLLTATIDPRNCVLVKRRDPLLRLEDYKRALRLWLAEPTVKRIIYCENSGFDLSELRRIAEHENYRGKEITILSQETPGQGERGKGYGDIGIIGFVLSACGLREQDLLIRVTGRYYIANMSNVVATIEERNDADIFTCTPRHNGTWIDSECYCGTRNFLEGYFCGKQEEIDDSQGVYIEHVLAKSVRDACVNGFTHVIFSDPPETVGLSGTYDLPLHLLHVSGRGFARRKAT